MCNLFRPYIRVCELVQSVELVHLEKSIYCSKNMDFISKVSITRAEEEGRKERTKGFRRVRRLKSDCTESR